MIFLGVQCYMYPKHKQIMKILVISFPVLIFQYTKDQSCLQPVRFIQSFGVQIFSHRIIRVKSRIRIHGPLEPWHPSLNKDNFLTPFTSKYFFRCIQQNTFVKCERKEGLKNTWSNGLVIQTGEYYTNTPYFKVLDRIFSYIYYGKA